MMRVPSGDQVGFLSNAGLDVKRRRVPRVESTSQISPFPSTVRTIAAVLPSGESCRLVNNALSGGVKAPICVPDRVNQTSWRLVSSVLRYATGPSADAEKPLYPATA